MKLPTTGNCKRNLPFLRCLSDIVDDMNYLVRFPQCQWKVCTDIIALCSTQCLIL